MVIFEEFVEGIFKDGKSPEDFEGVKPLKKLDEIEDGMRVIFVNRDIGSASAYLIEWHLPIGEEKIVIVRGSLDITGYNAKQDCIYSLGDYEIRSSKAHVSGLSQERLDNEEVYVEDLFQRS